MGIAGETNLVKPTPPNPHNLYSNRRSATKPRDNGRSNIRSSRHSSTRLPPEDSRPLRAVPNLRAMGSAYSRSLSAIRTPLRRSGRRHKLPKPNGRIPRSASSGAYIQSDSHLLYDARRPSSISNHSFKPEVPRLMVIRAGRYTRPIGEGAGYDGCKRDDATVSSPYRFQYTPPSYYSDASVDRSLQRFSSALHYTFGPRSGGRRQLCDKDTC